MNPDNYTLADYFVAYLRVGVMLMIMMTSEYLAGRFLRLPKVNGLIRSLGWLSGIALVVYAVLSLAQFAGPTAEENVPAENSFGLIMGLILIIAVTTVIVINFITRRIGPRLLAMGIAAFYGFAILSYLVWRQILPTPLGDNEMVFLSVSSALVLLGIVLLLLSPILFEKPYRPETMKINILQDPSKFGEGRRKRLNKKRSRY